MTKQIALGLTLLFAVFIVRAGEPIDINTADVITIAAEIKGIGQAKAKAIVKYREENGLYENVEELLNISGIGEKTLEKIRDYVRVSRNDNMLN